MDKFSNDELINDLKSLIDDLKYEPFEIILQNHFGKICDDEKNERIILENMRRYSDMKGFNGQCEELSYIAGKRIKVKYPNFRIQVWQGSEDNYFTTKLSHVFILIKFSFFKNKNLIVDPSLKIVNFENLLHYNKERLLFDSLKFKGVEACIDGYIDYNVTTPIFFDTETNKLFYLFFYKKENRFFIYLNKKPLPTLDLIKKYTKNKRFLLFCKKLDTYKIEKLQTDFTPIFIPIDF